MNSIKELSMYISKTSLSDGLMKWAAVNSDVDWDLYGERMSINLYDNMLGYIENETPPPDWFKDEICSEFWCGGMPYLSIAHYSDQNGNAVPGEPLELFVDGKQLKAKGILYDTELGKEVWKSLKEDEDLPIDEDRIRISIAFVDLAHRHGEGNPIWTRKSATDVCPQCRAKIGNKIYEDGYLVHLALTRVPVNRRTLITVEKSEMAGKRVTKKQDAASIVKNEALVEEIAKTALEQKSDIMVEMSEAEDIIEVADGGDLREQALALESKAKKEEESEEEDESGDEEEMTEKKSEAVASNPVTFLSENDLRAISQMVLEGLKPTEAPIQAEKSATVSRSTLEVSVEEMYNAIHTAKSLGGTLEEKLSSIQPALEKVGNEITAEVKASLGGNQATPVSNDNAMIMESLTTLTNVVTNLAQTVAIMQEKSVATPNVQTQTVPVPRSIPANLLQQKSTVEQIKPGSVKDIARRSTGIQ